MFWTAFIWGLGVSCGSAFGLLLFCVAFWSTEWLTGRSKSKADIHDANRQSVAALKERNELTKDMIDQLARIARHTKKCTGDREEVARVRDEPHQRFEQECE